MDGGGCVFAVTAVGHVAGGTLTSVDRHAGVAEAVPIEIGVERALHPLVHLPVAVLITPVAHFGRAPVHPGVAVVAVGPGGAADEAVVVQVDLVHRAVAVIVREVARLAGTGEDGADAIVAVAQGHDVALGLGAVAQLGQRRAEAIAVAVEVPAAGEDVVVDLAVAVLVAPVAGLEGTRVGGGDRVVAVAAVGHVARRLFAGLKRHVGVTEAVPIEILIERDLHPLIHLPVAVLITPITHLGRAPVHLRVAVVAVGPGGAADEAVAVQVDLVHRAVAVVVHEVAGLAGAGEDRADAVVAVAPGRHVALRLRAVSPGGERVAEAVAVAVLVVVLDWDPLVGATVTVLVEPVAGLGSADVDRCGAVVAVATLGHVALRSLAGLDRRAAVTEAVSIGIGVEPPLHPLVRLTVAVLITPVTHLGGAPVHLRVAVVAVRPGGAADEAVTVQVDLVHHTVAVVVHEVAGLRSVRGDSAPGVITIRALIAAQEPIAIQIHLVDHAVAVVVQAVARLRRGREHGRQRVVAVRALIAAQGPVAVQVDLVDRVVAVIIHCVAGLRRAREDRDVGIVAVHAAAKEAIAVEVHVVDRAIAVMVDPVAGLHRVREDRGVVVVAVRPGGAADEAVAVPVDLIHRVVAIVVQAVAGLVGAGEDGAHGVVAVAPGRHVALRLSAVAQDSERVAEAIAVAVPVVVLHREPLVHALVAVLVQPVAGLDSARVDGDGPVVAVGAVGHVPRRLLAGLQRCVGVAEAVPVEVVVERGRHPVVGCVVAVVVGSVADLRRPREDRAVVVVAVRALVATNEPIAVFVHLIHRAIAVVVTPVAGLRRARKG